MVAAMEGLEGSKRSTCHWTVMNALLNVKNLPKEEVSQAVTLLNESDTARSLDLNSRVASNMQTALMFSIRLETVVDLC